ncbi:PKD domain-containing protein [Paludibacter sp. 221]|uniref:PKD domain-containing protein n=1 Tax=Paludibacter sp. 221 TaxID=2302939 RepID=UPI0013D4E8A3|nr:PKD domain-containing protein [Paludibacter sp. 221]NDV46078.1 PKD domain-containing protein [Paludibacter sp. 221]
MKKNIFSNLILLGVVIFAVSACKNETAKPRANFSYEVEDLKVTFTNASKDANSYAWDFGDGKTSTETNPVHTYAANGTYSVKLTASGEGGTDSTTESVVVEKQAITIDGDFSDWDDLGSAVASTVCAENASLTALKSLKAYADNLYIYLLVEFDDAQITDKSWVPFHIYLDADNSKATGGYGDQFADASTEAMLEGALFDGGQAVSFDPAGFKWCGEVGGTGWEWGELPRDESNAWGASFTNGSGVAKSATTGNKVEIAITRELIALIAPTFADTFGVGVDIQQNWSSVGLLPNLPVEEDGTVNYANTLKVTIAK